jgi:hypothetical protein
VKVIALSYDIFEKLATDSISKMAAMKPEIVTAREATHRNRIVQQTQGIVRRFF